MSNHLGAERATDHSAAPECARLPGMRRREHGGILTVLVLVVAVLGAAAFAGWWFLLRDDAAPRPEIEKTPIVEGGAAEGAWRLQPDDTSGSFVQYRIQEEFVGAIQNTATGKTTDVTGTLQVDGDAVSAVTVEANLAALESDEPFRDGALGNQGLETNKFPKAAFVLTRPITLPSSPVKGETVNVQATGDLTLHGVTKTVTIPLEGRWDGTTIQVVGRLPVKLADYGMSKPTAFKVASVADEGELELQLFFVRR